METTNEKNVQESEQSTRKTIIGELALLVAVLINSFGVVFIFINSAFNSSFHCCTNALVFISITMTSFLC